MNLIIDDIDTRVEVSGGGLSLLMIHGWKDSLETFDELTKELENDYKVIRLDLPGFGGSQAPPEPWGASQYADFISKTLLKLEEPEIYAIIVHSMGARIAINALGRRAISADKLVIMAGAGIPDRTRSNKTIMATLAKSGSAVASVLPKDTQKKLRRKFYKMTGSTDYLDAGAMRDTFLKLVAEDSRKYATDVHAETLLIYSSNDRFTPPEYGEQFAELIPNSKLVIVEDLGHNIHKNDPKKILSLIEEFL